MAVCSDSNSSRSRTACGPLSSVRCPSMMRRASSASSLRTDTRTSPSSATARGNTLCATSDPTTDITPFASSRPRTMLASTSECVRKITVRSAKRINLQKNHRHVVVLWRVADKRRDVAQDALAQFL